MTKYDDAAKLVAHHVSDEIRSQGYSLAEEVRNLNLAVQGVRDAITDQTEYMRESDREYFTEDKDSGPVDKPGDTFIQHQTDSHDNYNYVVESINSMRRRLGMPDVIVVPPNVRILLQSTHHRFVERDYVKGYRTPNTCQLCNLPFTNPVHLIQVPQLPEN